MVTRRAERALTTRDWERRFRVAKSQPHRAVLHYRQGRLQQACTSHLTCFALSLHNTRHTHQVKHRILRIFRMQVCIEHQHWANAQLMHLHMQGWCWDEQGPSSKSPLFAHNSALFAYNLCLGQPELPGIGIGDHAIWNSLKGKKALAHRRPLAVTTRLWYPAYAWIASMGYDGLQIWAMNPRSLTCS